MSKLALALALATFLRSGIAFRYFFKQRLDASPCALPPTTAGPPARHARSRPCPRPGTFAKSAARRREIPSRARAIGPPTRGRSFVINCVAFPCNQLLVPRARRQALARLVINLDGLFSMCCGPKKPRVIFKKFEETSNEYELYKYY